ncbi:2,5-didehydrogluconate reductase DkgB [Alteromonas halophila]|uniref:2,5-diketo-D-gluconate reductase B n=1 Tax=Alteromonas halophila TaxID=516698 RepID=A0A918MYA6_9ALTE|nr:2,5-didehydrogluconate reductase DkgB [Alteromonas halophila]GGW84271.1 2,5-diketo-D-gluconate reductase B [Alteromonas halophila]
MTKVINEMPKLGMGTFRLEGDVCYDAVSMALEEGYRHIDTAQIYGNEEQVGRAIKDSGINREELFITTKVWNDKLSSEAFIPSVKESLSKLGQDHVDLLLVHWPAPPQGVSMAEYLNAAMAAKSQGLTKEIGVSNFTIEHLTQAINIIGADNIFTNQVEVHPYLTNDRLRFFCEANDIHITAYMPFAVGKVLKDETIMEIAHELGISAAQVVIAWVLEHGMTTIPSSTKRAHLKANFDARDMLLSDEHVAHIDGLNRNDRQATPDFAPQWDE